MGVTDCIVNTICNLKNANANKGEKRMTRIYFVRHAQPLHSWKDDRTRPLTEEGHRDTSFVLAYFRDKEIDDFYCSPYRRSVDTIAGTADYYCKNIIIDERLRERKAGDGSNYEGMYRKRWENLDYHEECGESILMVQERNIEALNEILGKSAEKNIVIGTHGTALSSILNYYDNGFGCDDFLRIIDRMPYIIRLDFDGSRLLQMEECFHIEKEYQV